MFFKAIRLLKLLNFRHQSMASARQYFKQWAPRPRQAHRPIRRARMAPIVLQPIVIKAFTMRVIEFK